MLHYFKAKRIFREISFIVTNAVRYSITDDEYLLQLHLSGVEDLYWDWYHHVLLSKFGYSEGYKESALWTAREVTKMLNEWRFENHYVAA